MKICDHVVFRYEPKLLGGKTFIFNMKTQKILLSDESSYHILRCVLTNPLSKEEVLSAFGNTIDEAGLSDFLDTMYENDIIVD